MRLDKHGNPYLIWTYHELTKEEKIAFFHRMGDAIARHKRAYYLGNPTVADVEYDYIEGMYEAVAEDLGLEPKASNQVGYKE